MSEIDDKRWWLAQRFGNPGNPYDVYRSQFAGLNVPTASPWWQECQDRFNCYYSVARPYRSEDYAGLLELGIRP